MRYAHIAVNILIYINMALHSLIFTTQRELNVWLT